MVQRNELALIFAIMRRFQGLNIAVGLPTAYSRLSNIHIWLDPSKHTLKERKYERVKTRV